MAKKEPIQYNDCQEAIIILLARASKATLDWSDESLEENPSPACKQAKYYLKQALKHLDKLETEPGDAITL